jgi:hypothetical protein
MAIVPFPTPKSTGAFPFAHHSERRLYVSRNEKATQKEQSQKRPPESAGEEKGKNPH